MKAYTSDPKNVQIIDESIIKVTWKDDHESDFDSFKLRVLCPCAECRGGHGGQVGDNTKHLQPPITAKDYARVGRYALAFHFSDLHRAGIYSFDYLRDICPCEKCKGNAPQNYI